ncbi:MAG: hypothetical protein ACRCWR_12975 [Saezia sp.]
MSLSEMEEKGERRPGKGWWNGFVNNAQGEDWFPGPMLRALGLTDASYKRCGPQSWVVGGKIAGVERGLELEWVVHFVQNATHHWIEAYPLFPSGERAPVLIIDPLYGEFTQGMYGREKDRDEVVAGNWIGARHQPAPTRRDELWRNEAGRRQVQADYDAQYR